MGTSERRLEILKYLCKVRKAKMTQLAEMFGVSVRTIQRDIYEIESVFRVPLDVKSGKYDAGVYIIGNYSFDHIYMCDEELLLLSKIRELMKNKLSEKENEMFSQIIKKYSKTA